MKTTIRRTAVCLLAIAVLIAPAWPWGNEGHSAIDRVAAEKLPPDVPAFLRKAEAQLAYLGPEPDRWRQTSELALKRAQEPDHFIDLEMVEGMELPPDRYSFYRALEARRQQTPGHPDDLLPERVGLQPYIAIEIFERLVVAFREYRHAIAEHRNPDFAEANAIFYAGWLSHYVGDAANPLHTTIHHNGWVGPNPNRLHHRQYHSLEDGRHFRRRQSEAVAVCRPGSGTAAAADGPLRGLLEVSSRISSIRGDCLSVREGGRVRWRGHSGVTRVHPSEAGGRGHHAARHVVHGLGAERKRHRRRYRGSSEALRNLVASQSLKGT